MTLPKLVLVIMLTLTASRAFADICQSQAKVYGDGIHHTDSLENSCIQACLAQTDPKLIKTVTASNSKALTICSYPGFIAVNSSSGREPHVISGPQSGLSDREVKALAVDSVSRKIFVLAEDASLKLKPLLLVFNLQASGNIAPAQSAQLPGLEKATDISASRDALVIASSEGHLDFYSPELDDQGRVPTKSTKPQGSLEGIDKPTAVHISAGRLWVAEKRGVLLFAPSAREHVPPCAQLSNPAGTSIIAIDEAESRGSLRLSTADGSELLIPAPACTTPSSPQ